MAARDEFKLSAENFSKLRGFMLPDETVQRLAHSLESGSLFVFPSLENAPPYDIDNLNWSERYGITTASQFQLYLQALYTVAYLTRAFELDSNKEHLILAKKFVESWLAYESDPFNAQINQMIWNSHCAALRSENLIYFALLRLLML